MRTSNETQSLTDAVMSVIEHQWPETEVPDAVANEVRTAISAVLATQSKGTITPGELAERWGISPDKVLNWIRNGDLKAVNVAATMSGRPRFRISDEDIEDFQSRRQPIPPTKMPPRRRRKPAGDVIEFF
ncbi:MAG: helix-turn-helix domain-containing protein [Planctomycetaceae bacterium]|nr:helix-turn-helix domain-containing protein [Planctomycetaceae bacterium]